MLFLRRTPWRSMSTLLRFPLKLPSFLFVLCLSYFPPVEEMHGRRKVETLRVLPAYTLTRIRRRYDLLVTMSILRRLRRPTFSGIVVLLILDGSSLRVNYIILVRRDSLTFESGRRHLLITFTRRLFWSISMRR